MPIALTKPYIKNSCRQTTNSNTHRMTTRSKVGITKPKVFISANKFIMPKTVWGVLTDQGWYDAIKNEYDALIRNQMVVLVLPPKGRKILKKMAF